MIARRIIIFLLFVLFFVILELNKNTVLGWILLALATAGLITASETGVLNGHTLLKAACWVAYIGLFAGIFFLTYPPVKRVPAALSGELAETGIIELKDGKVSGVLDRGAGVELYAGIPYAAPPVGELRWKEPQDPEPWDFPRRSSARQALIRRRTSSPRATASATQRPR